MINNKLLLKQLIWLINEEKNFYNNYDDCLVINYVKYIETLYSILKLLE